MSNPPQANFLEYMVILKGEIGVRVRRRRENFGVQGYENRGMSTFFRELGVRELGVRAGFGLGVRKNRKLGVYTKNRGTSMFWRGTKMAKRYGRGGYEQDFGTAEKRSGVRSGGVREWSGYGRGVYERDFWETANRSGVRAEIRQ